MPAADPDPAQEDPDLEDMDLAVPAMADLALAVPDTAVPACRLRRPDPEETTMGAENAAADVCCRLL